MLCTGWPGVTFFLLSLTHGAFTLLLNVINFVSRLCSVPLHLTVGRSSDAAHSGHQSLLYWLHQSSAFIVALLIFLVLLKICFGLE